MKMLQRAQSRSPALAGLQGASIAIAASDS
jgi:hypothetical protein